MWTIFKVFIGFVTILLLLNGFGFLALRHVGVLAPWSGIEPATAALESEVLTTGPPGEFPEQNLLRPWPLRVLWYVKWHESRSVVSDSLQTPWTIHSVEFSRPEHWSGYPFPLQGIFPTQGLNQGLPHCRQILYQLSHKGSPCNIYLP